MGVRLPQLFLDKMERLLGAEYEAWLASYEQVRRYGFRVNTLKLPAETFVRLTPLAGLTPIPWMDDGFYYREEDRPGRHPHYNAGLYYIQEPSAMVPAMLLDVMPGDRVLDLCAAPGGKSLQLAAKLRGRGILVSNDNAADRTKVLAKNIELAGVRNAVVLNEEPARLAVTFRAYFDKILVDAPCSGEGMFRKDESMIAQWEKHSVERCSVMQRDILRHAADMLAPGGTLVYSTCTFSTEENEVQIASLLRERPKLTVVPVKLEYGWQSGRPEWTVSAASETDAAALAVSGTVRLWPHLTGGEGHYAAVLRHTGEQQAARPAEPRERSGGAQGATDSGAQGAADGGARSKGGTRYSADGGARGKGGTRYSADGGARGKGGTRYSADGGVRSKGGTREASEQGHRGDAAPHAAPGRRPVRKGDERSQTLAAGRAPGRSDGVRTVGPLRTGTADGRRCGDATAAQASWRAFAEAQLIGADVWPGSFVAYGSRLYLQPPGVPALHGLRVVRPGWHLGDAAAHRFEPSQALAMGLAAAEALRTLPLDAGEADTARYLRGDTLEIASPRIVMKAGDHTEAGHPDAGAKGHVLVLVDGYPAGWGKWNGGLLKNGLAPGWRRT